MPIVKDSTSTKFRAIYDDFYGDEVRVIIKGTGFTYTSLGSPAALILTGGTMTSISLRVPDGEGGSVSVKFINLSIADIATLGSAGVSFGVADDFHYIVEVLAGSQIELLEGSEFEFPDSDDLLYANDLDNDIALNGGDDEAHGRGGNDFISGGDGSDTLYGGAGDDTIYSAALSSSLGSIDDHDLSYGGAGSDYLVSGYGVATMYGGSGNDTLENNGSDGLLYGGKGHDIFNLNTGVNKAYGGKGNDTFNGVTSAGQGTDNLFGGNGADSFHFGRRDVATGGGGADVFIFDLATDLDKAVVKDFDLSKDHIQMVNAGLTSAADGFSEFGAHAADVVAGVKYVSGGDTIILKGVSLADLTVDHFI